MRIDEFAPALAAIAKGAQAVGSTLAKGAKTVGAAVANKVGSVANAAGKALAGEPASPTGGAAQASAQQDEPQQAMGAMDIVSALKDPKIAQQMKAMKQQMPGGDLDAMVDPKGAADQQKLIQDLGTALDTLKKNAGIK
jgi:hypothetical protein